MINSNQLPKADSAAAQSHDLNLTNGKAKAKSVANKRIRAGEMKTQHSQPDTANDLNDKKLDARKQRTKAAAAKAPVIKENGGPAVEAEEAPVVEDLQMDEPEESGLPENSLLGKRDFAEFEANPLNMMMIHNLNQSHNTQRRRDIKQNYKAKLPLDKLILEHEKKKVQLTSLLEKKGQLQDKIKELWERIGYRKGVNIDLDINLNPNQPEPENAGTVVINEEDDDENAVFVDQTEVYRKSLGKTHWDYLLKELEWMADDFEKEQKKKIGDAKKFVRNCKKHINEKKVSDEKKVRELKAELKRKSKFMSSIVQMYWKSCEKIVKHNYNVQYEQKRQQQRTKKLENFVSKHLKLSVKVAEQLNTKQFVQQSIYKAEAKEEAEKVKKSENILHVENGQKQIKIYDSQEQIGMEHLEEPKKEEEEGKNTTEEAVELAQTFQPTATTLDKQHVNTQIPFLLRGSLREYQIIGLDWLVTLHNRKLNGILADEMGLGKTIQTISMLASLACDKGIWGPHLIVVPTTIIMNWEMEFKRWCPGFKILTYFGSQKERKIKRHGWSKENSFHICITSYKLVIQDHFAFRRKKWYYMILDEAQNIKNFKSQRWQTMLRFNTKRRLLLTGTPLQNDVMELWSLMHFLMPNIFQNQQDFKEWFSNPFSQSVNQNKSLNLRVVQKLQSILRPFLLRRMKRDVEKQLPEKIEHIVQCNLSRRQRLLYDEYINMDKTRNILADSDFFSIMSVLMQLRKVCNHPDLFEARTIESPFILTDQDRIIYEFPTSLLKELDWGNYEMDISLQNLNFKLIDLENRDSSVVQRQQELVPTRPLHQIIYQNRSLVRENELPYHNNPFRDEMQSHRPFPDGLASFPKHHTNSNGLFKSNCTKLAKSIQNIMPYDIGINYKMHYHKMPTYLNSACLPFSQEYFSISSYDQMRFSKFEEGCFNPVDKYKSAIQKEEQKQMLVNLGRTLAIWHSMDRKNRFQILNSHPLYGSKLRQAIEIPTVCQDIFEARKFKYINWKKYKQMDLMHQSNAMYFMPQTVFNPVCKYDPDNQEPNVKISEWPEQSEVEVDRLNLKNLFIKEITCQTLQAIKLRKERREYEEKMRQPKRVQRKKEVVTEYSELQFNLYIDMAGLKQVEDVEMEPVEDKEEDWAEGEAEASNPNVWWKEETVTNFKTEVKTYEEVITYREYLEEQNVLQQIENPASGQGEANQQKSAKTAEEESKQPQSGMKKNEGDPEAKMESLLSISYKNTDLLSKLVISPMQRASAMEEIVKNFKIIIPKVVSKPAKFVPSKIYTKHQKAEAYEKFLHQKLMQHKNVNQSLKYSNILFFPHKNLVQYDCGKLQKMAQLLKTLYNKGSKVIIFTQMTKMLDIFEQFLNLHGYIYVRLDGSVKTENRQKLVDRFNFHRKIFCFISSTRCGGVGINLTGADCVIFYDTDWNPSMDKQAQDRCHRIGQTKTVHIYRLISVNTIEENIFKKSLQKRELGGLIIEGNFNQEFFEKVSVKDILKMDEDKQSTHMAKFKPKRIDIFKDENIVFDDVGERGFDAMTGKFQEGDEAVEDGGLEVTSQDIERQQREFERQQQVEQYRKRFEEALIQIEDQEDVAAMEVAKREIHDNDDEEMHEFDLDDHTTFTEGLTEEQKKQREEKLEQLKMKELQAKQKINDGISLTQGDIKKHEAIEWDKNSNLNKVTKKCLDFVQQHFSFEEYLEERAKKDSKFVSLNTEEAQQNMQSQQEEKVSDFSVSDDNSPRAGLGEDWDRMMAAQFYQNTRVLIEEKLVNFKPENNDMYFSQQYHGNPDQADELMEPEQPSVEDASKITIEIQPGSSQK